MCWFKFVKQWGIYVMLLCAHFKNISVIVFFIALDSSHSGLCFKKNLWISLFNKYIFLLTYRCFIPHVTSGYCLRSKYFCFKNCSWKWTVGLLVLSVSEKMKPKCAGSLQERHTFSSITRDPWHILSSEGIIRPRVNLEHSLLVNVTISN